MMIFPLECQKSHLVVTKPLYITFRNYIESGIFLDTWEESHIAIHKK